MANYNDLPLYGPSDQRELELREIDQYDSMNPDLFYDYVERLERAKDFLDKHVTRDKSGEMKRSLLDYSGLAGGMTNFWQNPYEFTGLDSAQAKQLNIQPDFMGRPEYAYVHPQRPYDVNVSAENIQKEQFPAARLLGHELGHTKTGLDEINRRKGYGTEAWRPNFSPAMYQDLARLTERKGAYYKGSGMGFDPDETMGYLRGREGELRQGKTLMDDPDTASVFKKYPGSYAEYTRASKVLKGIRGRK